MLRESWAPLETGPSCSRLLLNSLRDTCLLCHTLPPLDSYFFSLNIRTMSPSQDFYLPGPHLYNCPHSIWDSYSHDASYGFLGLHVLPLSHCPSVWGPDILVPFWHHLHLFACVSLDRLPQPSAHSLRSGIQSSPARVQTSVYG